MAANAHVLTGKMCSSHRNGGRKTRQMSGRVTLSAVRREKYAMLNLSNILVFLQLAAIFFPLHLMILPVPQTLPMASNTSALWNSEEYRLSSPQRLVNSNIQGQLILQTRCFDFHCLAIIFNRQHVVRLTANIFQFHA